MITRMTFLSFPPEKKEELKKNLPGRNNSYGKKAKRQPGLHVARTS